MSRGGPDIKAIFTAALELPEGPDREAYLDAACGAAGLRRRVEELLVAFVRASDVLGPSGTPAAVIADEATTNADADAGASGPARRTDREATDAPTHASDAGPGIDHGPEAAPGEPGTTAPLDDCGIDRNGEALAPGAAVRYFGDYEIRRELGRGGMGVVYEARQVSLNRPVALKMVRAGLLAGDAELRRFQNEAEAVALLDHPGVVPVYEVGEHDGQRYFSMKLVPGGSLVPMIDRYKNDPRAAARLVAEAAEAVAHAHARGILHRDLKPANILVDAEGHPHVTDFGLAKKAEADVEFTLSGAILGTPAYMSPEQATGRRGAITTATDVYGLGTVLYALLTGRAPFGGDSAVETIDAVRNTPPDRPSRVNSTVPRDLETICLKCLEKDPRRRYPSAQALVDDLYAWLESRPIAARRVGPAERAWLWCRRKPAIAALSAAVALALVGGTAAVIAVQAKANADLRAANKRVEQRYELALEAIRTLHTGGSEDFLLKQAQSNDLRDRLLRSAADFYRKLGALLGRETDRASRRALAASNFELAGLTTWIGRPEEALAAHRVVLAAREALAAEPGADAAATVEVGQSLTEVVRLLALMGKYDEALATYNRAESVLSGPAGTYPKARAARAACRSVLAEVLLFGTGRTAEALELMRQVRADREELAAAPGATDGARRDLAGTLRKLGELLGTSGKLVEAEPELRAALALHQKLADDNPADIESRPELAACHTDLGWLLRLMGKPAEGEVELRAALALQQRLAEDNPAVALFRFHLAGGHHNLGHLLWQRDRPAEAEAQFRAALAIHQKVADDLPSLPWLRSGLASIHISLGRMLKGTDKPAEAEPEFRAAMAIWRKLADDYPAVSVYREYLASCHRFLGELLETTGRPPEAEAEFRAALAMDQKLADDNPAVTGYRDALAVGHRLLGELLLDSGRPAEAEAEHRTALAIAQKLANDEHAHEGFRQSLALIHSSLGWMLAQTGRPAEAEAEYRVALALYGKRAADNPKDLFLRDGAANLDKNLSIVLRRLGRLNEARDRCDRAVKVHEALVKEDPKASGYRSGLAENYLNRGLARRAQGDPAGAAADLRRAVALYDTLPPPRSGTDLFLSACSHAALSGLAGQPSAGVSIAEGPSEADSAMALLHRAVRLSYRNFDTYRIDDALDPLRGREDFKLLMMDLTFPAEPLGGVE
jgi:tetratricopeptide (TPR) repeat protein